MKKLALYHHWDKQDIVDVAIKIGSYETSILPYEDCCTTFVAKHPVTKPSLSVIKRHEKNLEDVIDGLMETALNTKETVIVRCDETGNTTV